MRANVGLLLQETLLPDVTVREAIAQGRPGASDAEIEAAARAAGAHEFVAALPDGYATRLGQRGRTLSGGQRQRLAIARALVRDTPVLVLDEPTTGLDAAAKAALLGPLRALAAGRTTIVVSHDPDVLAWADRVVTIADGRRGRRRSVGGRAHEAARPGARLGDGLEVIAHLARSNVLDVYDAWSERRGCRVAVKALRPDRLRDARARGGAAARGAAARAARPSAPRARLRGARRRAAGRGAGDAARRDARRADRASAGSSAAETAHLGLQLGSALRYLHGEGLVHLDVKPSNVIAHAGAAKLIDLSIARRPGRVKAGLGTWCNLAPEQARGGLAGPPADVWGLGTVLYEALTGAPPFGDDDDGEYPCLERRADRVRSHRPRAPRALAEAIDAALEPDPADRPAIEELLDVLDAHAGRPAGPGRWSRRARAGAAAPPSAARRRRPGARGRTARARRTRPRAGR